MKSLAVMDYHSIGINSPFLWHGSPNITRMLVPMLGNYKLQVLIRVDTRLRFSNSQKARGKWMETSNQPLNISVMLIMFIK